MTDSETRLEKFENYTRVWRYYPEDRKIAFYQVKNKWVKCSCGYPAPYEIEDSDELYCPVCEKKTSLSEILGEENE